MIDHPIPITKVYIKLNKVLNTLVRRHKYILKHSI